MPSIVDRQGVDDDPDPDTTTYQFVTDPDPKITNNENAWRIVQLLNYLINGLT
jgi:hypothetical protein